MTTTTTPVGTQPTRECKHCGTIYERGKYGWKFGHCCSYACRKAAPVRTDEDPREGEHRDCVSFTRCLDEAARRAQRCVHCVNCDRYEKSKPARAVADLHSPAWMWEES